MIAYGPSQGIDSNVVYRATLAWLTKGDGIVVIF